MRFTLPDDQLSDVLDRLSPFVPASHTVSAACHVAIEADAGGTVRFTGTDVYTCIIVDVAAEVHEAGGIAIQGKPLRELASRLPTGPVTLATTGPADPLTRIASGRGVYRINSLALADMPRMPTVRWDAARRIPGADLRTLVTQTKFAVAKDNAANRAMEGILWETVTAGKTSTTSMVGTNGHRLSKSVLPAVAAIGPSASVLLPVSPIAAAADIFRDAPEVEVAVDGNHIGFRAGDTQVVVRLLEGDYPQYTQVIPKQEMIRHAMEVERDALREAIERMMVIANRETHRIRLEMGAPTVSATAVAGTAKLTVTTPDLGEAEEELAILWAGHPLTMAFNGEYALELLRVLPAERIRLRFIGAETPVLVEGIPSSDAKGPPLPLTLLVPQRLAEPAPAAASAPAPPAVPAAADPVTVAVEPEHAAPQAMAA